MRQNYNYNEIKFQKFLVHFSSGLYVFCSSTYKTLITSSTVLFCLRRVSYLTSQTERSVTDCESDAKIGLKPSRAIRTDKVRISFHFGCQLHDCPFRYYTVVCSVFARTLDRRDRALRCCNKFSKYES